MSKRPGIGGASEAETLAAQIYRNIKVSLMAGDFAPGQPITIRTLATAFGVSLTPVREAISRLTAAGGLESRANASVRVPVRSVKEIAQCREVRMLLEIEAAAQATSVIRSESIRRLEELQVAIAAARTRFDARNLLRLNFDFHMIIYSAAENKMLLDMIEITWLRSGPSLHQVPQAVLTKALFPADIDPHVPLIQALKNRDEGSAREAVRLDLTIMLEHFSRQP